MSTTKSNNNNKSIVYLRKNPPQSSQQSSQNQKSGKNQDYQQSFKQDSIANMQQGLQYFKQQNQNLVFNNENQLFNQNNFTSQTSSNRRSSERNERSSKSFNVKEQQDNMISQSQNNIQIKTKQKLSQSSTPFNHKEQQQFSGVSSDLIKSKGELSGSDKQEREQQQIDEDNIDNSYCSNPKEISPYPYLGIILLNVNEKHEETLKNVYFIVINQKEVKIQDHYEFTVCSEEDELQDMQDHFQVITRKIDFYLNNVEESFVMTYASKKVKTLLKQFKLRFLDHEINKVAIFLDQIIPEKYTKQNNIQIASLQDDLEVNKDVSLQEKTKILSYFNNLYSTNLIQCILKIVSQGMCITSNLSSGWRERNKFQNKLINYVKSIKPKMTVEPNNDSNISFENAEQDKVTNLQETTNVEIEKENAIQDSSSNNVNNNDDATNESQREQREVEINLRTNEKIIFAVSKENENQSTEQQVDSEIINSNQKKEIVNSRKQSETSSQNNNYKIQINTQNQIISNQPIQQQQISTQSCNTTEQQNKNSSISTSTPTPNPNLSIYQNTTSNVQSYPLRKSQEQQQSSISDQPEKKNCPDRKQSLSSEIKRVVNEELLNTPASSNKINDEMIQQKNEILPQINASISERQQIKTEYKYNGENSNSSRIINSTIKNYENEDFDLISELKRELINCNKLTESSTQLKQSIDNQFNQQDQLLSNFTSGQNNTIDQLRQKQKLLFEFIVNLNSETETIIINQQRQIQQFQEESLQKNKQQKEMLIEQISKQEQKVQNHTTSLESLIQRVQQQEDMKQIEIQQQQQAMQEASRLLLDCSQALLTRNPMSISQIRENLYQSQINQSSSLLNIQSSSYVFGSYPHTNQSNFITQKNPLQVNQNAFSDNEQIEKERYYNSSNIKNRSQRDSLSSSFQSQKNQVQNSESYFKRSPKMNNVNNQAMIKQVLFNQQNQSNFSSEQRYENILPSESDDNKILNNSEQIQQKIMAENDQNNSSKYNLQQHRLNEENDNIQNSNQSEERQNIEIINKSQSGGSTRKDSNSEQQQKIEELKTYIENMNTPEPQYPIEQQDQVLLINNNSKNPPSSSASNISSISPNEQQIEHLSMQVKNNEIDSNQQLSQQSLPEKIENDNSHSNQQENSSLQENRMPKKKSDQIEQQNQQENHKSPHSQKLELNIHQSSEIEQSPHSNEDLKKSEDDNSKDILDKFNSENNLKTDNVEDSNINQQSSSQLNIPTTNNDLLKPSSTDLNSSTLKSSENMQDDNICPKIKKKHLLRQKLNQNVQPFKLNQAILEQITSNNEDSQPKQPQSFAQNSLRIFGFEEQQVNNSQQFITPMQNPNQQQLQNNIFTQINQTMPLNDPKSNENQNIQNKELISNLNFFSSKAATYPLQNSSSQGVFESKNVTQAVSKDNCEQPSLQNQGNSKNLTQFIEEQQKKRKDSTKDLQESFMSSHNTSQVIPKSESSIFQSELFEQPKKSIFEGNGFMYAIYQQAQETQQKIEQSQDLIKQEALKSNPLKVVQSIKQRYDKIESIQKKINKVQSSSQSDQDEYKNNNSASKPNDNTQYKLNDFKNAAKVTILKDQNQLFISNKEDYQSKQSQQRKEETMPSNQYQNQNDDNDSDGLGYDDNDFQDCESNNEKDIVDIDFNLISDSEQKQPVQNLRENKIEELQNEEVNAYLKKQADSRDKSCHQDQVLQQFLKPSSSSSTSQKSSPLTPPSPPPSAQQQNTSCSYYNQQLIAGQTVVSSIDQNLSGQKSLQSYHSNTNQQNSHYPKNIYQENNTNNGNSNTNNNTNRNNKSTERSQSANKNSIISTSNSTSQNQNQNQRHTNNHLNYYTNNNTYHSARSQSSQANLQRTEYVEKNSKEGGAHIWQRKMSESYTAATKSSSQSNGLDQLKAFGLSDERIDEEEKLNSSIISRQTELEFNNIYDLIKPKARMTPKEVSQILKKNCEDIQQNLNKWKQQEDELYFNNSTITSNSQNGNGQASSEGKKKKLNKSTVQMVMILKLTANLVKSEIIEINSIVVNTDRHQMIDQFKSYVKPTDMRVQEDKDNTQFQIIKRLKASQHLDQVFARLCNFFKPYLDNYKCCILYDSDSDPELLYNELINKKLIPSPQVLDIFYTCILLTEIYPSSFHNKPIKNNYQAMLSLGIKKYRNTKGKTHEIKNIEKVVTKLLDKGVIITSKDVRCAFSFDHQYKKIQQFINYCKDNFEISQYFFILQFQHGKHDGYNEIENSTISIQILQKTSGFSFLHVTGFYGLFHYDFYRTDSSAFHFFFQSYLNAMKINSNQITLLVIEEDNILANQAIELMFPLKKKPFKIVLLKEVENYIQLNLEQVILQQNLSFDFEQLFSLLCGQNLAVNNLFQV